MTTPTSAILRGLPLPKLSDEAAVEIYWFMESLFDLFDARYGEQIQRHYENLTRDDLIDSSDGENPDDPIF